MNDMSNAPISESRPESVLQVWTRALTKPNEQTFVDLASSPKAKASTAYLWVFVAALIQLFLVALVQNRIAGGYMEQFGLGDSFGNRGTSAVLLGAVCGAPVAAAISTLFFAIWVFVLQWIAGMFGGRGTADQLAYTLAAIAAPFSIISGVMTLFSAIPYVGYCFSALSLLAGLYVIVLQVMAIKGVNQISWGAAIGTWLIPGLVIGFLCACLVGASLAALVPILQENVPGFAP
jgi:hypothetical protein